MLGEADSHWAMLFCFFKGNIGTGHGKKSRYRRSCSVECGWGKASKMHQSTGITDNEIDIWVS